MPPCSEQIHWIQFYTAKDIEVCESVGWREKGFLLVRDYVTNKLHIKKHNIFT